MTTIAWDGQTLAADGQSVTQGNKHKVVKAWKVVLDRPTRDEHVKGHVALLAVTGDFAWGLAMKRWFMSGAWPDEFKAPPTDDNFARLVVIDDGGRRVRLYEALPDPVEILDEFAAWGTGVDFALAAMALGRSARDAVSVAHRFDPSTGECTTLLRFEEHK